MQKRKHAIPLCVWFLGVASLLSMIAAGTGVGVEPWKNVASYVSSALLAAGLAIALRYMHILLDRIEALTKEEPDSGSS